MNEYSFQFPKPELYDKKGNLKYTKSDELAWNKRRQDMNAFIEEALKGTTPPPKQKTAEEIDAEIYKAMQEKGRNLIVNHYSWEIAARQYLESFKSL